MVDIHCHILHGIDDGAEDFSVSIKMAEIAEKNGTTAIIATPHCNIPGMHGWQDNAIVLEQVRQLNAELVATGSELRVFPGCEIFVAGDFINLLKSGQLLTLNNSVYPLVEFDFYEHPASVFMKLQQICAEGFVPIVAHPERYAFVDEDDTAIDRIMDLGCLVQINKGSLAGRFGSGPRLIAHNMLLRGQADFIASDAHGTDVRTPVFNDVYTMVKELYSEDYADILFNINPLKVINNQRI